MNINRAKYRQIYRITVQNSYRQNKTEKIIIGGREKDSHNYVLTEQIRRIDIGREKEQGSEENEAVK